MIFLNNSNHTAFVYGNIIKPNDIFKVNHFRVLCSIIDSKIATEDAIGWLNRIFTPLKPENPEAERHDIAQLCDTYDNIIISEMHQSDGIIIQGNDIIDAAKFIDTGVGQKITNKELLIIESTIQFDWGIIEDGEAHS